MTGASDSGPSGAGSSDMGPSPLEERLVALIRAQGPISVADYMADALGHPHFGYYMSGAPIGAAGDFTTAPEVSQVFGELVGAFLVQSWIDMGEPSRFHLVELGPGRGVLMADILRAGRLRPGFRTAAEIWLVETSGRLRHEQSRRLSQMAAPNFADKFADVPPGPALIVANEFFDCLPIRQFLRVEDGWRERMVGVSPEGRLAFTLGPTPPPASLGLPTDDVEPGAIFELCAAGVDLAADIARHLALHQGRALIVDYGHLQSGLGETLQAVKRHAFWPPLATPGQADLSAHVDFESLARAALEAGAVAVGPVTQGRLLLALGAVARAEKLAAGKSEAEADAIRAGVRRLIAPDAMGEIFKALCLSSPGLAPPAGFP
ncbi:MAG: SAM-dependent methyltransferase [Parvularculaceae bacterium]|nr:SAM-dependent methyltransferase [Parvularculaceae bacterium]